jgi:hypothetical protein
MAVEVIPQIASINNKKSQAALATPTQHCDNRGDDMTAWPPPT